jgi:hypothetical protein
MCGAPGRVCLIFTFLALIFVIIYLVSPQLYSVYALASVWEQSGGLLALRVLAILLLLVFCFILERLRNCCCKDLCKLPCDDFDLAGADHDLEAG